MTTQYYIGLSRVKRALLITMVTTGFLVTVGFYHFTKALVTVFVGLPVRPTGGSAQAGFSL